jgi:putative transposase
MSQSLSKIFVHFTFHVKGNRSLIPESLQDKLYAYIGKVIKNHESIPIAINGMPNHIHILCVVSKNISSAKLMLEIKASSSKWIKTKSSLLSNFSWQAGYGAFSVSPSIHDVTKKYIENQKTHHKKVSYKQEYLELLNDYGIDYNEKYLWT